MAVHFNLDRMEQVCQAHERWWKGELDRPLLRLTIADAHPGLESGVPVLSQANCTDFSWSPEQVIDALDDELSRQEYLGDAFPIVCFDSFGPGVLAAFCGARLDNASGRVWFLPQEKKEIEDIHARYNPDNMYVQRIKALYRAGLQKWNGAVIMTLPDLGGVLDVAATLRGSENLLMDLLDSPEEVVRLRDEIQDAWYEAYEDFSQVLRPQRLNSNWSGLLSKAPSYIIQCDFSYMIGNAMLKDFVLDTLRRDTQRLQNTIYHLDGVGELNHLDDILALENLNAVQWVFGDGKPDADHWLDVYRRIIAGGKQYMICGTPQAYINVMQQLAGSHPYASFSINSSQTDLAKKLLSIR